MERKKINKLLACTALVSGFLCFDVQAKEIETNMAQMQAMDKITGRVSVIEVPVNGDVKFGSFSIVVRACKTRPPEETPENFAFVDVVDDYNGENPKNIFRGWMMSSTPALNPVEHPIYDVWLLKCLDGKVDSKKLLTAEQLKDRDGIAKAPNMAESLQYSAPNEEIDAVAKTTTEPTPLITPAVEQAEQVKAPEVMEEKVVPTFEVKGLDDVDVPTQNTEAVAPTPIVDDGSPKSLINFNETPSTVDGAPQPSLVDTQALENAAEDAVSEAATPPPVGPQALIPTATEPDAPAEPQLLIEQNDISVIDESFTRPTEDISQPQNETSEAVEPIAPQEQQLIEFGEVEEEPLDMQTENVTQ